MNGHKRYFLGQKCNYINLAKVYQLSKKVFKSEKKKAETGSFSLKFIEKVMLNL